jgi:hypothetical protein
MAKSPVRLALLAKQHHRISPVAIPPTSVIPLYSGTRAEFSTASRDCGVVTTRSKESNLVLTLLLLLTLPSLPRSLSTFPSLHIFTSLATSSSSSSSPSSSSLYHPKIHTRHSTYCSTLILVVGDITLPHLIQLLSLERIDLEPLYARYTSCDQQNNWNYIQAIKLERQSTTTSTTFVSFNINQTY